MKIEVCRTGSDNKDFQNLVKELDADLKIRDGDDHAFYNQFNKIDALKNVVVAYDRDEAIGCGAIKVFSEDTMEVKRMYVPEKRRGRGIASIVLKELENWCKELGFQYCILETGKNQPEAISLYKKNNYQVIPNYGQYRQMENSVCFKKVIT